MHRTNAGFWKWYKALPEDIRARADKQFALLQASPRHPSLQFKKLTERGGQEIWSARVTRKYRALAAKMDDEMDALRASRALAVLMIWKQRRPAPVFQSHKRSNSHTCSKS